MLNQRSTGSIVAIMASLASRCAAPSPPSADVLDALAPVDAHPHARDAAQDASTSDGAPPEDARVSAPDSAVAPVSCGAPSGDFYAFAGAIPTEPGAVVRCEELALGAARPRLAGHRAFRVLYSTSTVVYEAGAPRPEPRLASGTVFIPRAPASAHRLVIANTHGTTGVIARCAPSINASFDESAMLALAAAAEDAVLVAPDFIGLGADRGVRPPDADTAVADPLAPTQRLRPFSNVAHPWLSIEGEGRATIDLVRAARALPSAGLAASARWFVAGQSQGGHAALAAAEVSARGYAPELELRGVIAGAPTSMLESQEPSETEIFRATFPLMLVGLSLDERDVRASRVLSDRAMAAFARSSNSSCLSGTTLDDWIASYSLYLAPAHALTRIDPLADTAARAALRRNDPGHQPVRAPLFIGQVVGDPVVIEGRTRQLVARLRATNSGPVTYCEYTGSNLGQPWLLRANNHAVFSAMFAADASARGRCTDRSGASTSADATSFLRGMR